MVQGQCREFMSRGSKNSGGLGVRGTSHRHDKSLDLRDYQKCQKSTRGVLTRDPAVAAPVEGRIGSAV